MKDVTDRLGMVVLALALVAPLPVWALEVVLRYQGDNRWVAQDDKAPLVKLLREAGKGATAYKVVLPAAKRDLSTERLAVLQDLLEREAKAPVVMEETSGSTKANTLKVEAH
ncbi:MAG: hypothetical protein GC129_06200 [Proteobacteria bacterium]|nr:hypothetical protein [Pseudomonadota bacterium]